MSFRFLSGRQACLPELRVYHNILRGNNLQQKMGGVDKHPGMCDTLPVVLGVAWCCAESDVA
jgi:hypothetical protein